MIPNWENRPEITAHLINPAFCTEIMRECISSYKQEANNNFPFALTYLVLPLILNNRIRERLPKNKSNTIHAWINENEDIKIDLAKQITSFLPFTRETIMFALSQNSVEISEHGDVVIKPRRRKMITEDIEILSCLKKATILGKVLSKSGTPLTIFLF